MAVLEKIKQKTLRLAEYIATEKNFTLFIILTLLLIPLGELITNIHGTSFISQTVIVAFAGWAGLIMSVSYFLERKRKYYPSDIFLGTLLLFALISYVFSADGDETQFGYHYDEWLIHYIAYFTLMFAATNIRNIKYKKYILAAYVAVTIINIIPAFFQSFGIWFQECYFLSLYHQLGKYSYAFTQNCNFYAGISTVFTACSTMLFLFAEKKSTRNFLLIVSIFSFYCSMSTGARIAIVGNICFFLFMLVYEFIMCRKSGDRQRFRVHFRRIGVTVIGFTAVLFLVIGVCGKFKGDMGNTINEIKAAKDEEGFDGFGSHRGYIWRIGLESVPDFWATGTGLDNYVYAFRYRPDFDSNTRYQEKAHNEYLHILVTEGAFALANYLMLLFYAFFTGIKGSIKNCKKDSESCAVTWIFLVMFIAYTSQACFNSSVVNTTPYFWAVLGMVMTKDIQKPLGYRKKIKEIKLLSRNEV